MSFILTKNAGVPVKYLIEGYIEQDTDRAQLRTDYTLGSKIKAIDTGKTYVLTEEGWKYLEESSFDPSILDDYYTKEETDELIAALNSFVYVDTLPTENIQTNVIYLVPAEDPSDDDVKDEYLNLDGTSAGWERIGSTKIDLTQYYTKTETDAKFVEKEAGKGLSTNDYTTAEKQKLAGLDASDFATAAQGTKADNAETKNTQQDSRLDAIEEELVVKKTVSGNIVSIHDAAAYPAEALEFAIEPVQDLHGYDKPWPAGGGKNLFNANGITSFTNMELVDGIFKNTVTDTKNTFDMTVQCWNDSTFVEEFQKRISDTGRKSITFSISSATTKIRLKHNGASNDMSLWFDWNKQGTYTLSLNVTGVDPTTIGGLSFTDVQIELGSTATSYEPYSNICPISGWTGVQGERTGKNLYKQALDNYYLDTVTGLPVASSGYEVSEYIPVIENAPVHIPASGTARRWLYDVNKNPKVYLNNSSEQVYTPTENGYIRVSLAKSAPAYATYQIELGDTATTYEPYQGTSIPITFPTEAGTVYGGKAKPILGKLVDGMAEVDLGTFSWTEDGSSETNHRVWTTIITNKKNGVTNIISDTYKTTSQATVDMPESSIRGTSSSVRIYLCDSRYDNVTDFTTAVTGSKLVYELATPIEYDITPQQVQMLLGDNNVWCDTGDTTLTYYSDSTISQLLADLDSRADALESDVSNIENNYLPKAGGALTGDVTTSNTTFGETSLVPKSYVDSATMPVWQGTRAQYNALQEPLPEGTIVFITDEAESYEDLSNRPSINSVVLSGNKTGADLGLVDAVPGKGLSTNDYDNTEKAAVAAALPKTGGAMTGDITTSVTTFTNTSLVTKSYVDSAIAAITDYESEVFPNG